MKYLGVDYGAKHIGVAESDESGAVAFPLATLAHTGDAATALAALFRERGAGEVVFGESLDNRGNDNPIMGAARAFARELGNALGAPVRFEREFFTSAEAGRAAPTRRARASRGNASKEKTPAGGNADDSHARAAALILQRYLDRATRHPMD